MKMEPPSQDENLQNFDLESLKQLLIHKRAEVEKKQLYLTEKFYEAKEKLNVKRNQFNRLNDQVFQMNQHIHKMKSDVKHTKTTRQQLMDQYVDANVQLSLTESDFEYRMFCGQSAADAGGEIAQQQQETIENKRDELEGVLDDFRESRQEAKAQQELLSQDMEFVRQSTLNTTALLKSAVIDVKRQLRNPLLGKPNAYAQQLGQAIIYLSGKLKGDLWNLLCRSFSLHLFLS